MPEVNEALAVLSREDAFGKLGGQHLIEGIAHAATVQSSRVASAIACEDDASLTPRKRTMDTRQARRYATEQLLKILESQPNLLSPQSANDASGTRLAQFCEHFIEEYAKTIVKTGDGE